MRYNDNKHSYYTRKCMSFYTIQCIITIFIYYIRRYIMTTNISVIHESVYIYSVIQYLLLLYKKIYNDK